jgi:rod shape-determining protein MreC
VIIVAAVVALVQILAQRNGMPGPIVAVGSSVFSFVEDGTSAVISGVRGGATTLIDLPHLAGDNRALAARNERLALANAALSEQLEGYRQESALQPVLVTNTGAIEARVIGFPPEDESLTVTLDRGSRAGVKKDDGVITAAGIVGIVASAEPFSSKVVLITDYTSRIPAVVGSGRWWGIARGNVTSVRMEYVAQDATLRAGDTIVTGEGRTFHSGSIIGTVMSIERTDASLYQTAVVRPAADLGALDRVVVIPR